MKNGHWKVCLKSGEIIDDDRIFMFETNTDDYRLYLKDKADILYVIGKDSLDYAAWIEGKK